MMETERSAPVATRQTDTGGYLWTIRLTAGMFTLLQVLITTSAAISAYPAVLSMQRSLVNQSEGGGVSIDQLADPLLRLFSVTYVSALASLVITFGLACYAGRIVIENSGDVRQAARAGTLVALASGLVWLIIGIPAVLLTHADGTVSWLVATVGVILVTPAGPPTSSVYVSSPGLQYLLIQFLALLLQVIIYLVFGLSAGAVAGRIGAAGQRAVSAPRRS